MTSSSGPCRSAGVPRRWARGRLGPLERARSPQRHLVVVKVGGSLLSRPDWPVLVDELAADEAPCCLVVGGGAVVEGLRVLDAAAPQPARLMHELAIDALELTARLAAEALGLPLVAEPIPDGTVVLDVAAWLAVADRGASLPAGWQVTSDTIAALVAVTMGRGLVLAKRVPPPPCPADDAWLTSLADAGWVDRHFPTVAASLPSIEWAAPAHG